MYFNNDGGTGSYTTSTTNMYNKDRFHVRGRFDVVRRGPRQRKRRFGDFHHRHRTRARGFGVGAFWTLVARPSWWRWHRARFLQPGFRDVVFIAGFVHHVDRQPSSPGQRLKVLGFVQWAAQSFLLHGTGQLQQFHFFGVRDGRGGGTLLQRNIKKTVSY